MTQRISTLVCSLLVVFYFQSSFAQDELSLDDSFAVDTATTPSQSDTAVVPPDTSELNLDAITSDAPAIQSETQHASVDESLLLSDPAGDEQSQNVNLASPLQIRQQGAALYGFSVGLMLASQPLQELYDVTTVVQGSPVSTTRVNKQTDNINSYGVMLRYAVTPFYSLGTDLNVSYSKSQNHNSITVKDSTALGEITTLKGELNFSYAIEMGQVPVYFLLGFGAEKISGQTIEKIMSQMGYGGQVGAGFVINSTFNLEALYSYYEHRVSNNLVEGYSAGTPTGAIDTEKAKVINQGFIVRGSLSLNM